MIALALSQGAILDLGDIKQFKSIMEPADPVGENGVWMSGDRDGFDVEFSKDLHSKLRLTIEGCNEVNNDCYNAVRGVLDSLIWDIDSRENRHLGQFLSETFGVAGDFFAATVIILLALGKDKHEPQPNIIDGIHLPKDQATSIASALKSSSITVSASNTVIMTITPTPDIATVTGPHTPAVTSISTPTKGLEPGDYLITLDDDLASRIDEVLHRFTDCPDGNKFESGKLRIRASGWGAAICGAEGVLNQVLMSGESFTDLRVTQFQGEPILFNGGDPERAARLFMDYATAVVPLLDMLASEVTDMANMIFALAINALIDNIALGAENPVRHSILTSAPTKTATKTATTTSCTATTKDCIAECGEIGLIEHCKTQCQTATVCSTKTASTKRSITTTTTSLFDWPTGRPIGPTTTATAAPIPDCSMDRPAIIPWDVFYGPKFTVASDFCKAVEKDPKRSLAWTVNNKGEKLSFLKNRAPPTDPGSYKDYQIQLSWEPADGFGESACPHSCNEAYRTIATSPCNRPQNPLYLVHLLTYVAKGGHTGGGQNTMAKDGSWDIGCGFYSWNIKVPSHLDPYMPLKLGPQGCNNEADFPGHQDIHGNDVYWGADVTCINEKDELGPGDTWERQIRGIWKGSTSTFKELTKEIKAIMAALEDIEMLAV
ncbi:hypothetical protein DL765_006502 [Monosporascus sp. GIB2]|nr:hypothetical protein DL765_006502 [Monosporascus sp. GIB2]